MSQETRVGLFVMGGILIIALASFFLGDIKFERRYRVYVLFNNVNGLPVKGPVKSSGVEIGRVEKIDLDDGRARVTALINKKYPIHADATARIGSSGFIGTKFLDIARGSPPAPLLQDGDTIEGKTSVSIDDLAEKLSELFKKDEKFGDPVANIKATLRNLKDATGVLSENLTENKERLSSIIRNADRAIYNIRDITEASREDIKVALSNLRKITEQTHELLARIQEGKGAIGKLVSDPETAQNVKETVASLKETAKDAETVFGRIRRIQVYWDYRQRYDFGDQRYRADLGLKLVPRPGKFYQVELNNVGNQKDRNQPGADLERRNTITGVFGKDFGPLTAYVGFIRSRGGIGGAFRPFWRNPAWDRRFEIQAEAYDFSRNEFLQGQHFDKPVYNAGFRVGILRWLYAGVQVEDIAIRSNVVGNLNVQLRDDDIAYLLGLASLGKP